MTGLPFPDIDPIAFSIGPLSIHWYALAYLAGFLGAWGYAVFLLKRYGQASPVSPGMIEELLPWIIGGVILGGRIVYTLVYNPILYLHNPADIFKIWQGGMSFHGGLAGAIVAMAIYGWKKKLPFLAVTDVAAVTVPIGIFLGRIANFINGELYGRITSLPFGVVFPHAGPLPRHPSQLYEAALEGLAIGIVLYFAARRPDAWKFEGLLSGLFLTLYGLARFVIEFARQPDEQIGFVVSYLSMGQLLCLPMIAFGLWILLSWKRLKTS